MKKTKKSIYVRICFILTIIGYAILGLGIVGSYIFNNYDFFFASIIIGPVLIIPDAWKGFMVHNYGVGNISGIRWFIVLPLLIIVGLIYFLNKNR